MINCYISDYVKANLSYLTDLPKVSLLLTTVSALALNFGIYNDNVVLVKQLPNLKLSILWRRVIYVVAIQQRKVQSVT